MNSSDEPDTGPSAGPEEAFEVASAERRLEALAGPGLRAAGLLGRDEAGRPRVRATPPIHRGSMVPDPWIANVLVRVWRRLFGGEEKRVAKERRAMHQEKWRRAGARRRLCLLVLVFGQTAVATYYMKSLMPYQGWSLLDLGLVFQQPILTSAKQVLPYVVQFSVLVLFVTLFCWVSSGFWTALMGFWQLLTGKDRYSISADGVADGPIEAGARTAIVMPICNEDVSRVFAGLRATYESVVASGELQHFDFFVLSDSYDADIAVAEQQAWIDLCRETDGFGRIFYRRRRRRVKRKSGNIDDFCRRWGPDYRYMVVMDADSVMTGECLTKLVRLMEAHPGAGIIQTGPRASGMDTFYARMQQFATRVYGPLFTAGLHFWQLGESHYWGHNAIIRVQPFMEHCALAPLPGKGTFSGAILSHDFVEAALMRRAGWGVWIAYDLPGSYEELPPNLLDELQRDRRWCQGNLMNFRLFLVKGMHPVHRAVFLTGVMSYLSAPLWFLFLVLSTALLAVHTLMVPQYFMEPGQLFPIWPRWHPKEALALFSTTLTLLFLPKLLSILVIYAKGAKEYGGAFKVTLSMLMEMLGSMLLAPVRMIFHSWFVAAAFLGWSVQWKSPQREDGATTWGDALRAHGGQVALGLAWSGLVAWLDPVFLWWLSPIVVALMLSAPVSVITSRVGIGRAMRRLKLFLIPEEYDTPKELLATDSYAQANRAGAMEKGFLQAVVSPTQNALAVAMATSRHHRVAPIERRRGEWLQEALAMPPEHLPAPLRLTLLSDPEVMTRLHQRVWKDDLRPWIGSWRNLGRHTEEAPRGGVAGEGPAASYPS